MYYFRSKELNKTQCKLIKTTTNLKQKWKDQMALI